MKRALVAVAAAVLVAHGAVAPSTAWAAEERDTTPYIFGVSGAILGGFAIYVGFEAQIAGAHEKDPSEAREGLATAFTVVSISSLVLSVVSVGVAFGLAYFGGDDDVVASTSIRSPTTSSGRTVRVWCPDLSCLPGAPR